MPGRHSFRRELDGSWITSRPRTLRSLRVRSVRVMPVYRTKVSPTPSYQSGAAFAPCVIVWPGLWLGLDNRGFVPARASGAAAARRRCDVDAPVKSAADEAARTRELAIANEALREGERESRLIVDCIPGLVAVFTPGGELEFVNRPICEYFGKTLEELKHWGTGGMTHPEDLQGVVEVFTHSIASGDPFEIELRAQRFDGVYRWFQSRGLPLRNTNGDIVRWYNLLRSEEHTS